MGRKWRRRRKGHGDNAEIEENGDDKDFFGEGNGMERTGRRNKEKCESIVEKKERQGEDAEMEKKGDEKTFFLGGGVGGEARVFTD
jgi:hypothetical protein